jgi:hypothetical protein
MAEGGGGIASAELFDPTRNSVQRIASLAIARSSHTATALPDGRVLVAGGYSGTYLNSLEIFDPKTNEFHTAGSLREARSGHTATLLPDGRVLFVGGVGDGWTFLRSAEVYDPKTARSELVGPMSVERESHTATRLEDGSVLVVGGHRGRREHMEVFANAERFDPQALRFEAAGTLGTARHKHDAIRLLDGRVLVIGGADRTDRTHYATTEVYDPALHAFSSGPSMTHRRYKIAGTAVLLPSGNVLVPTGARSAEIFDVAGGAFHPVGGRYPAATRFAATALLPGGDVVIAGGYAEPVRNTDGVWRYAER